LSLSPDSQEVEVSRTTNAMSVFEGESATANPPVKPQEVENSGYLQKDEDDALASWALTDTDESGYNESTEQRLLEEAERQAIITGRVLVVTNISKMPNIIQLLLVAKANAFIPVIVCSKKTSTSDLIKLHAPFFRLSEMSECHAWLKKHDIPLLGIEIMDTAISVDQNPFHDRIAFMPGNEGTGLSDAQKRACDGYVIIPQYGKASASLNVHIATCLVLYRYVAWNTDKKKIGNSTSSSSSGNNRSSSSSAGAI